MQIGAFKDESEIVVPHSERLSTFFIPTEIQSSRPKFFGSNDHIFPRLNGLHIPQHEYSVLRLIGPSFFSLGVGELSALVTGSYLRPKMYIESRPCRGSDEINPNLRRYTSIIWSHVGAWLSTPGLEKPSLPEEIRLRTPIPPYWINAPKSLACWVCRHPKTHKNTEGLVPPCQLQTSYLRKIQGVAGQRERLSCNSKLLGLCRDVERKIPGIYKVVGRRGSGAWCSAKKHLQENFRRNLKQYNVDLVPPCQLETHYLHEVQGVSGQNEKLNFSSKISKLFSNLT